MLHLKAAAKLSDESVPLVKLAAERTAFENRMAEQARRYEEVGINVHGVLVSQATLFRKRR